VRWKSGSNVIDLPVALARHELNLDFRRVMSGPEIFPRQRETEGESHLFQPAHKFSLNR